MFKYMSNFLSVFINISFSSWLSSSLPYYKGIILKDRKQKFPSLELHFGDELHCLECVFLYLASFHAPESRGKKYDLVDKGLTRSVRTRIHIPQAHVKLDVVAQLGF